MGKLLLIGAVVLIALLAFTFLSSSSDTTASATSETIQNITVDMRSQFDEFSHLAVSGHQEQKSGSESSGSGISSDTRISREMNLATQTASGSHFHYYNFVSGTDRQYTLTVTPESVPAVLQVGYYPPEETYTKGYTDVNTKTWKDVTRTVYSPQSRAEILICDQSGRVVSSLGFAGKYSAELIGKTVLRSPEPYTITITGNHISLGLSY